MTSLPDTNINTNTTVGMSSNPNVSVQTNPNSNVTVPISSNANMEMVSQQYGYYGYRPDVGYGYVRNPYAAPPQEAPVVDVVLNINPNGYTLPYYSYDNKNGYLDNNNQGPGP